MTAPIEDVTIVALGRPTPQGAIRSLGKGRPSVHGNAARLLPWRESIKLATLAALNGRERLDGPVSVSVVFSFDKPRSAPRTRRCWPVTRSSGDVDKLARACLDALVDGGAMFDDSQVVRLVAEKVHVGDDGALHIPGAAITVRGVR